MARLSVNEMTTLRWSFEDDVQQYLAAGYAAIGVWRQKLADFGEEKGAELLAEVGLEVSSLMWVGGFTGSDGHSYRESVDDALEAVRLAQQIRAECLVMYTGARGGHTHNHARRLIRSALNEIGRAAAEHGVTLAIEPMHPGCSAEWTFLTGLDDTLELIDSLDSSPVKVVFDCYHLLQDGPLTESLATIAPRIALLQLGDARVPPAGEQNRCPLGEGTLPLEETLDALLTAGYDGFIEIELMGEDVESCEYADLLARSRETAELWLRR